LRSKGIMRSKAKRPSRIGVVGIGGVSRLHLDGLKRHPDRATVVAVCDTRADVLAAAAAEFQAQASHTDVHEMIAANDLDAAIVCTPTPIRRAVVEPLLRAGVPVLIEKPLAETYAEASELADISRETGTPAAVNQNFRRHFGFALARDVIASGEIGDPQHLTHVTSYWRTDQGWRTTRRRYLMSVMSIHWFDGYRFMLNDEAESVYAQAVCGQDGADVAVSVVIRMRKGTLISLSESFRPYQNHNLFRLDATGGGMLLDYGGVTVISADRTRRREVSNPFDKPEATFLCLEDLLNSRSECRDPETAVADNLGSMRILEAAYRSIDEGRVVRVSAAAASNQLKPDS
jgi:predicted dehydrogenase